MSEEESPTILLEESEEEGRVRNSIQGLRPSA